MTTPTDSLLGAFGLTDNLEKRVQGLCAEPANNLLGGNFLISPPNWVDLSKVSCDPPNLGGSEESFCRSSLNWVDRKKL